MNADKLAQLRELFEMWLASRPSFRTTVEVQAAWEGWKANTAVAAMLAEHDAQPVQAAKPVAAIGMYPGGGVRVDLLVPPDFAPPEGTLLFAGQPACVDLELAKEAVLKRHKQPNS